VLCFGVLLQKIADGEMTHGCRCEIKNVIIVQLVYFLSLDIFDFLLFCACLLWLAGECFIFGFCMPGKL
jgi:hypothetical protein